MVINIKTDKPYNLYVESGVLNKTGDIVSSMYKTSTRIMLISDSHVAPLYADKVMNLLRERGFKVCKFVFCAGEESKTVWTVMEIYRLLSENGFTKNDLIITLGGGVAGDIGGFAAATFLRGMDFIRIPTTLLAQVEAGIGGNTGIDLPYGKNLVGAVHEPRAVIVDPQVLRTLPKDSFIDGMGEVVKYGAVLDRELFADLESGEALRSLENTICKCILLKKELTENGEDESRRALLDFGHTFGQALERLHGFKDLTHGRAVAIGMVMAANIGENLKLTEPGTAQRLEKLLTALELPTSDSFDIGKVIDAASDKTTAGKNLNVLLLREIGDGFVHRTDKNYLILRCKILEEQKLRNGKA